MNIPAIDCDAPSSCGDDDRTTSEIRPSSESSRHASWTANASAPRALSVDERPGALDGDDEAGESGQTRRPCPGEGCGLGAGHVGVLGPVVVEVEDGRQHRGPRGSGVDPRFVMAHTLRLGQLARPLRLSCSLQSRRRSIRREVGLQREFWARSIPNRGVRSVTDARCVTSHTHAVDAPPAPSAAPPAALPTASQTVSVLPVVPHAGRCLHCDPPLTPAGFFAGRQPVLVGLGALFVLMAVAAIGQRWRSAPDVGRAHSAGRRGEPHVSVRRHLQPRLVPGLDRVRPRASVACSPRSRGGDAARSAWP